jgi:hypothetical protein
MLAAAVGLVTLGGHAQGATDTWVTTSGNWSTGANWSGGTQPANGDSVLLSSSNTFTTTFDSGATTTSLYDMTIDGLGGATDTFLIPSTSSQTLTVTDQLVIGNSGIGAVTQNGGTLSASDNLYLGNNGGSTGSFTLTNGSLSGEVEMVGLGGNGTFIQSGGTNSGGTSDVGYSNGATGSYTLSGSGTLTVGEQYVGVSGSGAFYQTGGTNSPNALYLGFNSGPTGSYTLSNGALTAGSETIGISGYGTFDQTGGSNSPQALTFGELAGSTGSYTLSDGSLTVTNPEFLGISGNGTFTQTGGTHSITGDLDLGYGSGASGTYTLSGNGSLSVTGDEVVGDSGAGTFTQSGGTNSLTGSLTIGSSGSYSLSGGTVSAGSLSINSPGTFVWNGGSSSVFSLYGSTSGLSTLTVPNGGTLCGNATVNAATTIASGGTITGGSGASPGNTYGTMELAAGATLNGGGNYVWKLNVAPPPSMAYQSGGVVNSANSSPGNMDALIMSSLTNSATSGSPFNISMVTAGTNTLTVGASYTFAIANVSNGDSSTFLNLNVFNYKGFTLSEAPDSTLATNANGGTNGTTDAELNGGSGEDLILTYEPTPEPTSLLLGGLAIGPLLMKRRRRCGQIHEVFLSTKAGSN